jgi:hypothetical protein
MQMATPIDTSGRHGNGAVRYQLGGRQVTCRGRMRSHCVVEKARQLDAKFGEKAPDIRRRGRAPAQHQAGRARDRNRKPGLESAHVGQDSSSSPRVGLEALGHLLGVAWATAIRPLIERVLLRGCYHDDVTVTQAPRVLHIVVHSALRLLRIWAHYGTRRRRK